MKCDELKTYGMNDPEVGDEYEMYKVSEVDAAIAELKAEHHKERHEYIEMVAQLKAKLEDAKATAYAESVDAGMENRRLKRTLWLARAERAFAERRRYCAMSAFGDIENDALRIKWCIIQHKCLAKMEEYK